MVLLAGTQHEIELILVRQLARHLRLPMFIVGLDGSAIYYNAAAEGLLGTTFVESGAMPAADWTTRFLPVLHDGDPVPADKLPLMIALQQGRPARLSFQIHGLDGIARSIEVCAFPVIGLAGRQLGAFALFWQERERSDLPPPGLPERRLPPVRSDNPRQEMLNILATQLADYMTLPVIVMDAEGTVTFYNGPTERILSRRFDESGPIPWSQWSEVFSLYTVDGERLSAERLPQMVSILETRPSYLEFHMRGLDGAFHRLSGASIPLVAEGNTRIGAFAMFWEDGA